MFSIAGDIIGLSLLAFVLEQKILPTLIGVALVTYHFATRHAVTEHKNTPHFGQKREGVTAEERKREITLGHVCDFYQVLVLLGVFFVTRHPLWIFGAVIFSFQYFLAVRAHIIIHDIQETYGIALVLLLGISLLVWPIFPWWNKIQRYEQLFYAVLGAGVIAQLIAIFSRDPKRQFSFDLKNIPSIAIVISGILLVSGVVGILVLPASLTVTTSYILLGNPSLQDIASYAIILIFLATLLNALVAIFFSFYIDIEKT